LREERENGAGRAADHTILVATDLREWRTGATRWALKIFKLRREQIMWESHIMDQAGKCLRRADQVINLAPLEEECLELIITKR